MRRTAIVKWKRKTNASPHAIIDLYKERHASERIVMDQTIDQVRRECKGYRQSVIRVRAARKLFLSKMGEYRDEKERALQELATQGGSTYTPRQVAKDKIKGPTLETAT